MYQSAENFITYSATLEHSIRLVFPFSTELLLAPCFYLYAYSLSIPEDQPLKKAGWHLLPGLIFLLHAILVYLATFSTPDLLEKQTIAAKFYNHYFDQAEDVLMVLWNIGYAFLSLQLLKTFKQQVLDYAGDNLANNLSWLQALFYCIYGMVVLMLAIAIADIGFHYGRTNFWHIQLFHIVVALFLYALGVYGFRQLMLPSFEGFKLKVDLVENKIDKDRVAAIFDSIQATMETNQLFLDPAMNLPTFARHLKLPSPEISQIIKQHTGQSFRDFLNSYRIKDVQLKLKDPAFQHLSILGIAYESGFNSEASFYRIFKKATGQSPSTFRAS